MVPDRAQNVALVLGKLCTDQASHGAGSPELRRDFTAHGHLGSCVPSFPPQGLWGEGPFACPAQGAVFSALML